MVSEQFNYSGVGLLAPAHPQLSWRTDYFLSRLSPLAYQSQFWSVGNSLFALTWLSHINFAEEPWHGHACTGLSRNIRHYSSMNWKITYIQCCPYAYLTVRRYEIMSRIKILTHIGVDYVTRHHYQPVITSKSYIELIPCNISGSDAGCGDNSYLMGGDAV
jgi:hypothetical protein